MEATERRMYPFVPTVRPDKPTAENRELRMGEVLRAHFFLEMNRSKKDEEREYEDDAILYIQDFWKFCTEEDRAFFVEFREKLLCEAKGTANEKR